MKTIYRPNAIPSNFISKGDRVDSLMKTGKYGYNMRKLKTIGDLCDFCGANIRVYRGSMSKRKYGYKFACKNCYKPNNKMILGCKDKYAIHYNQIIKNQNEKQKMDKQENRDKKKTISNKSY